MPDNDIPKEFITFQYYLWEVVHLQHIKNLLIHDQQTRMPKGALVSKRKQVHLVQKMIWEKLYRNPLLEDALRNAMKCQKTLNDNQKDLLLMTRWVVNQKKGYKDAELELEAKVQKESLVNWRKAKEVNDLEQFLFSLEKWMNFRIKMSRKSKLKGYNYILNCLEMKFDVSIIARSIPKVKKTLLDYLGRNPKQNAVSKSVFKSSTGAFQIHLQQEIITTIASDIGFNFDKGTIDIASKSISSLCGNGDCRIAIFFDIHDCSIAIDGLLSQIGVSLFHQFEEFYDMRISDGSKALYYSQVILWRDMIGKSKDFWVYAWNELKGKFQFGETLSSEDAFKAINQINSTLIRIGDTKSNEITFNLHNVLRYELERELFSGELKIENLKQRYYDLAKMYFGKSPENDAGLLNDVHWGYGAFGYFGIYYLASLAAAQIYQSLKDEGHLRNIRDGKFKPVTKWLSKHVYRWSNVRSLEESMLLITGKPLCESFYLEYLREKYTVLFETHGK